MRETSNISLGQGAQATRVPAAISGTGFSQGHDHGPAQGQGHSHGHVQMISKFYLVVNNQTC